jgi:hypothetical protein
MAASRAVHAEGCVCLLVFIYCHGRRDRAAHGDTARAQGGGKREGRPKWLNSVRVAARIGPFKARHVEESVRRALIES